MKNLLLILLLAGSISTATAQNENLKKTVEDGIKTSIQQTEKREWKEAFATCRELDALINIHEQKTKKSAPELHYLVSKERLRMYIRIRKPEQCKFQLEKMEGFAKEANSAPLSEDLLLTKGNYYQKFGMNDQSFQCYKELVQQRSTGKDEKAVNQCFQDLLSQAKENKNTSLTHALEKLYYNWQDSIKAVKAAQELQSLQNQYATSQNMLAEKEDKIGNQKGIIALLCTLVIALTGGLLFFIGIMIKNIRQIKKLKNSLTLANENNELKSQFINNIGAQVEPSLEAIRENANGSQKQIKHIEALKGLMQHIQQYMELESNREERYETKDLNISTLCEGVMEKAKATFKQEVAANLNVPRVNIRTNAEALENILLYLLENAAYHTETGKISLDFKKRSAHSGQFIVTDTGTGIPEEKRANLFKPFTEIQDLTQGDGLGLPTCSLIAYKLNGTLRLDEEYKKGTRFILELHS